FGGSTWTWTDGDSRGRIRIVETYAAYGAEWRITDQSTLAGRTRFTYSGANLARIENANGEYIDYLWSG
ncbi:hypothetical protein, partial [Serratia marcescens]